MVDHANPVVIQGGMGVNVSSWQLAREVSKAGQLGVVSGTALDGVLARTLQDGDPGGHLRRALEHFPDPAIAHKVVDKYFREGGRAAGESYRPIPTLTLAPSRDAIELCVLANFAHVWLAKEGHDGVVGINFLEKIQMATPTAALGAILGGVDYVIVGAGIPRELPPLLTDLAAGRVGTLTVDVAQSTRTHTTSVDPVALLGDLLPAMRRPKFLAIVSSHILANYLARDDKSRPDGFIVEGPTAGGHSAPPRGKMTLDDTGQPIYSARDEADLEVMAKLGLPFWLAGAQGTPEQVEAALELGAAGVQCGTIFATCNESGLAPGLRRRLLDEVSDGTLTVRNDPRASPTSFPFKVTVLEGSLSQPDVLAARPRLCDLSYLREPYERANGSVGYRCASEPVDAYVRKGGVVEATEGCVCLCNALMANVGLGQTRKDGYVEDVAVTLGQDLDGTRRLLEDHPDGWGAADAVSWLLSAVPA